jgi:V/A-type H+-transporting ATPase subunit E
MEANQVTEKIIADANAEAGNIKKQAEERRAEEQENFDRQLAEYKKQTDSQAKKAAEDEKLHLLAAARMDLAKEMLAEKRNILDEVFGQSKQELQHLPDDQYRSLCEKLMLAAVETGDEEVVIDKNEKRIDHEFIKNVNRKLGPGYKGNLRLSNGKADLGGGFILKRGKIKTNISLEVIVNQARKELEIDLAKELFA